MTANTGTPGSPPVNVTAGLPREQYERTVHVIQPAATLTEAVAIFRNAWRRSKQTVSGSYDDAGLGALNRKTAVLHGASSDQHQLFVNWYRQNYPGTHVSFAGGQTFMATDGPGDGLPREQYERTVHVIQPKATLAQAEEIFREAWQAGRQTVTGSYDDAGMGGLEVKTAILHGIDLDQHQLFRDWYETYYPGVTVIFDNEAPGFHLTHWPTTTRWVNQRFGANKTYYGQWGLDGHEGVDIAAGFGTQIMAAAGGEVYKVRALDEDHNYGIAVYIDHGDGYRTAYAHFQQALVNVGDQVIGGQPIGVGDSTGNVFPEPTPAEPHLGSHLHFNLYHDGATAAGETTQPRDLINPEPFLAELAPELFPQGYHGPFVQFVGGVDQPASDWNWNQGKVVYDHTGLLPKFHTGGNNDQWYDQYKHHTFNPVRILLNPAFAGDAEGIFNETAPEMDKFYSLGARDFIVLNEPNIEGMGIRWSNGSEFGRVFRDLCLLYRTAPGTEGLRFRNIRLWFPGHSPGFGAQHLFIDAAKGVGAFDHIYGVVEHVYTGLVDNMDAAVNEMVNEVKDFQNRHALDRPLLIGEFSVNRPASGSYKAAVYRRFYTELSRISGIQAAYSFTSTWFPHDDPNQEGWLEHNIHMQF